MKSHANIAAHGPAMIVGATEQAPTNPQLSSQERDENHVHYVLSGLPCVSNR